jgi:hypothetical protein
MDYEFGMLGLEKLSVSQVKSWLDKAETLDGLEANPENIREFASLFYPTANYIYIQFGGEYNDSGYDLGISKIQGAIKTGDSIEYLPEFDYFNSHNTYKTDDNYGKYSDIICAKSLKDLGYQKLSEKLLSKHNRWCPGVEGIYFDFKYSMFAFNSREVNSEFSTDYIGFNLETGELDGFPQIPEIYGFEKDFPSKENN